MYERIIVRLKSYQDDSYPLIIGERVFPRIAEELTRNPLGDSYAIIADSNVARLYGENFKRMMRDKNLRAFLLSFPAGEKSKTVKVWQSLIEKMLKSGLGRDSCVIALGGGVTGDLAGFVSASYLRGIPFIQVPTSLLAMLDASIGGKVGIDLPSGKNLIGAFFQPKAVYIDLTFLETLPKIHLLNGMAEAVKSGLIADRALFAMIEKKGNECLKLNLEILRKVIKRALLVKAGVVEQDEMETLGLRKILNYGHTIGHSLEALSGYQLLHGFAVSLGMRASARISVEMGFLKEIDAQRQNKVLDSLGFPGKIPGRLCKIIKTSSGKTRFFDYLTQDKKVRSGQLEMVLLSEIGRVKRFDNSWTVPVSKQMIELGLKEILE